jgi:hypothetical protein
VAEEASEFIELLPGRLFKRLPLVYNMPQKSPLRFKKDV